MEDSWLESYDNCGRSDISIAGMLLFELNPKPISEIAPQVACGYHMASQKDIKCQPTRQSVELPEVGKIPC